jgi:hypothetical protein
VVFPSLNFSTKWSINSCFDNFINLSRSLGTEIYYLQNASDSSKPQTKRYD